MDIYPNVGSNFLRFQVWQMVRNKLECTEVIATKEPVQKLDTHGQMIFMITHAHHLKVTD